MKNTIEETLAEIEKTFPKMPEMERVFKKYAKEIRYYHLYRWGKYTTKEKLIEKWDEFLKIATELDNLDLLILFYVRHIDGLGKSRALEILRGFYRAQCRSKNDFCGEERYVDILEIGKTKSFEKP